MRRPDTPNDRSQRRPRSRSPRRDDLYGRDNRRSDAEQRLSPAAPHQRKRPTAAARLGPASQEEAARRAAERGRDGGAAPPRDAGVHDFVKQHYNAVPERGKDFRNTASLIKELRRYNNWVKAVVIRKACPNAENRRGPPDGRVLDVGCGKGGDLQKWRSQNIASYVGLDPAEVSVEQARKRYEEMRRQRHGPPIFAAAFDVFDCFGRSIGENAYVRQQGFDEALDMRWGEGGFDVVSMMFCMHYAWESEEKVKRMLKNVAGALRRGGRMIGVVPDSEMISLRIVDHHKKREGANEGNGFDFDDWDPEKPAGTIQEKDKPTEEGEEGVEWGNEFYKVRFPGKTPKDGVFRPPFGNKYFFFLEESVEWVPEYVVPWGVFRGMAEDYGFSLTYKKTFQEVWEENKDDREHGPLADRMGVTETIMDYDLGNVRRLKLSEGEKEASNFYCAFEFTKI